MAVYKAYTIGFTKRRAPDFFETLKSAGIRRLVDVRLNNKSQLAGFTKREDLPYLLGQICGAEYIYEPLLAPTQAILDDYKKRKGSWEAYEEAFSALMAERLVEERLSPELFAVPAALLCSERTAEKCHRRLVLEYLQSKWGGLEIVHL
ncbi:MAG: DUF488 domain-containing protein [Chloroflexi bacterium]|nr:DUF488 domain-containing protein [Chloroflexota bacterium]